MTKKKKTEAKAETFTCVVVVPANLESAVRSTFVTMDGRFRVARSPRHTSDKTTGLRVTYTAPGADRRDVERKLEAAATRGRFLIMDVRTSA